MVLAHMNLHDQQLTTGTLILGGGVAALVAAVTHARAGKEVLLLTELPFLGGTISESLLCRQRVPENPGGITGEVITALEQEKDAILLRTGDAVFWDPEIVKWVLQEFAVRSSVRLLYHTRISSWQSDRIELAARQGRIQINVDAVVDLRPAAIDRAEQVTVCGFLTAGKIIPDLNFSYREALPDGRVWFADVITVSGDSTSLAVQRQLDQREQQIHAAERRIQLVAARPVAGDVVFGDEFFRAIAWEKK
jgi:NADPH-dependent 2,4-dienoyl-CoA reductase/sulfur reductase-like enzyme